MIEKIWNAGPFSYARYLCIPNNGAGEDVILDSASIIGVYELMRDKTELLIKNLPEYFLFEKFD